MMKAIGYGVFVIILLLCISPALSAQEPPETALEHRTIMDEYAKGWSENATLSMVWIQNQYLMSFTYSDFNNSTHTVFWIHSTGEIDNRSTEPGTYPRITNWTIDSDEVKTILNDNATFNQYISGVDISGQFTLMQENNKTIWHFQYVYWHDGIVDTGSDYTCIGTIDAENGELLEIETHGHKPNFFSENTCLITIIIIVVVVIILFVEKVRPKKEPNPFMPISPKDY